MHSRSKPFIYLMVLLAIVMTLFPLYWIFVLATRDPVQAFGTPKFLFVPQFDAFGQVWTDQGFVHAVIMSIFTTVLTILIALAVATPAAYIMVRRHVRRRQPLVVWLLVAYLLPDFVVAIPFYNIFQYIHLYDTAIGLALVYQVFMTPFAVTIMIAFFRDIPPEVGEAALIDGCTSASALWRVYLPLTRAGVATVAILIGINVWNEVTIALALTSDHPTVPIAVAAYKGFAALKWNQLGAASFLSIVPMIAFALFAQRHIVRGLTAGMSR
ncbi:MAG: hypothetical protein BGO26_11525 [Actinobacteria bacterium 69-20]|jgi:multiple sugar transport system permease protein|nr:carbohydrate ABC transporter permease [Actinomycetota bacterium]OJV26547.1 MAG: hypothetical protein BGO26_11525 [Actinobacteria bacterium 69-20]